MVQIDIGCGALEIWIECDGVPLEEYAPSSPLGPLHQECYIASEADKSFKVYVKALEDSAIQKVVYVYIDGGEVVTAWAPRLEDDAPTCIDRIQVSLDEDRLFTFGTLLIKEDDSDTIANEVELAKELGTLRVAVEAVYRDGKKPWVPGEQLRGDTAISEGVKKLGGHVTRLGEATQRTNTSGTRFITRPVDTFRIHDVTYHYAPQDLLYAREIIPRPAPSVAVLDTTRTSNSLKDEDADSEEEPGSSGKRPLVVSDESDELSALDDEDRAHYIRIKAQLAAKRVKREKTAKVEPSERPHFTEGEVIILSD